MSDGNGIGTAGTAPAMIASRQQRVEAGLMAVQEVEQERDSLRSALESSEADLRGLRAEHDALRLAYARMQTEMEGYQRDRDNAVDKRAKADALIEAVLTLMQKHRGPTLTEEVKAALDEQQANVVAMPVSPQYAGSSGRAGSVRPEDLKPA